MIKSWKQAKKIDDKIQAVLKPTEKTYIINGRKYVAVIDFIKNRFSLKYGKRIITNETLDFYTNADGMNLKDYVKNLVEYYADITDEFETMYNK
jgi:hypothetical protein